MTWYYQTVQPRVGKMFAEIKINLINSFPIPFIGTPTSQKKNCQRLSSLTDQMLLAQVKRQEALSDSDKKLAEQRITILDRQIDELVYELYGLTDEEIRIVEKA